MQEKLSIPRGSRTVASQYFLVENQFMREK
jgi:hypothetical protein